MTNADAGRLPLSALSMVKSVKISNFRGFPTLTIPDLARINVIVGDNAVGKTALLEAIYLTLCNNPQKAMSLRQWRGMNIALQTGSADSIVEGIYSDLFHDPKSVEPIAVELDGQGFENRKLVIAKTRGDIVVPTKTEELGNRHDRRAAKSKKQRIQTPQVAQSLTAPISLTWTDEHGREYITHVKLSLAGLEFESTGETIPDCYMYAAQMPVPPSESAMFFSALQLRRDASRFKRVFISVFNEITELSIATVAGSPVLLADVPWAKQLLPLPALSGGTTRVASVLLAAAQRENGVVLIDEIEAGVYHGRQERYAKALLEMSRAYKTQLIMTTHSEEWLENFIAASEGEPEIDQVAFWRMVRAKEGTTHVLRFTFDEFRSGMAAGEMR